MQARAVGGIAEGSWAPSRGVSYQTRDELAGETRREALVSPVGGDKNEMDEDLEFREVHRGIESGMRRHGITGSTAAFFILWVVFCLAKLGTAWGFFVGGVTTIAALLVLAGKPPFWFTFTVLFAVRRRVLMPATARGDEAARQLVERLGRGKEMR